MKHTIPMPAHPGEVLEADSLVPEARAAALARIDAYKAGQSADALRTVDPAKDIVPVEVEHLFNARVKAAGFTNIQGGYFDGTNYYSAFVRHRDGVETAVIGVFAKDGTYVRESAPLPIFHCNTIAPIGSGKLLSAVYDTARDAKVYAILDKQTLTVDREGTLPFPFLSADLCAETGLYACTGVGYGEDCRILDTDMHEILRRRVIFEPGSAPQNFCATAQWLYSPRYIYDGATGQFTNYVYIYSWDLGLHRVFSFRTEGNRQEVEALSVIDGVVYLLCGDHEKGQLSAYRFRLPE